MQERVTGPGLSAIQSKVIDLQSYFLTGCILGFLVPNWPLSVEQDLWPLTIVFLSVFSESNLSQIQSSRPPLVAGYCSSRTERGEHAVTLGTKQKKIE